MALPTAAPPRAPDLSAFVDAGVAEVRRSNALALAWLRLAFRTVTLALYARYLIVDPAQRTPAQLGAVFVNVSHLAVGAVVLALLRRRRRVGAAIVAGALSDFAVVSIAAWRAPAHPDVIGVLSFFMAGYELVLLFAALTLGTRAVAALSAVSIGYLAWLLARVPVWSSDSWLVLCWLAAFGTAATFAGTRMVELASRTAAEEYAAGLLRRHADELAASNAALREARARAELLTRLVVHDLRSPLTAVLTGLDVVRDAWARAPARDADASEALALARSEAWRLVGMTSDLVAIGKLEQGVRAQRAPTDVPALLAAIAAAHERQAVRDGVAVEVSAPDGLRASLDAALVRRAVENLVANALRHVGQGDRIALAAEPSGGAIRIAVRNSGPPVPAELRERMFDRDVSGSAADWSRAGLGLHFCRLAAEAHGGRVALVDRAGWNVSFELELPDADPAAVASAGPGVRASGGD